MLVGMCVPRVPWVQASWHLVSTAADAVILQLGLMLPWILQGQCITSNIMTPCLCHNCPVSLLLLSLLHF